MYFATIDDSAEAVVPLSPWTNGLFSPFEANIIQRLREVERETCYLTREVPKNFHLSLCAGHYSALFERAGAAVSAKLMQGCFRLWGFGGETQAYAIELKKTVYDAREGELSLDLLCGSKRVFTIAFTLLPGGLFQRPDRIVAAVTRIQGIPNRRDLTREVVKAMNDVAPPHALLAALKGVCEALGVRTILGCPSRQQIKFDASLEPLFTANYEDFFTAVGAAPGPDGYFALTLPAAEKPLSQIKRGHRIRTRLKRAIKAQIMSCACAALRHQVEAGIVIFDQAEVTAKLLLDPAAYGPEPAGALGRAA